MYAIRSYYESNKTLGYFEITGKMLTRDVSKGSDIEITISLSESQDLIVSAYLNMSDQDFKDTFNPKERHTQIELLKEQVENLNEKLELEISQATEREEYEIATRITSYNVCYTKLLRFCSRIHFVAVRQ